MTWIVFSYSLPSKAQSSTRVALWRRLRRVGAIAPTSGLYVLPAREECLETFQWLAAEVQQAEGDALVMHAEQFEGLTDDDLIENFRRARAADYEGLDTQLTVLEQHLRENLESSARARLRDRLARLQHRHAEIARIDFFDAPEGGHVASRLKRLAQMLAAGDSSQPRLIPAAITAYRDRRWVTRPRPHVDRLACVWLIRHFINPAAVIRYAQVPEPDEVAFDMRNAAFSHQGNLCTFETMVAAFGLEDPILRVMGEIVHEIDLRDGRYGHAEIAGVDAILRGWLLARFSDEELESHGVALYAGLYAALSQQHRRKRSGRKA